MITKFLRIGLIFTLLAGISEAASEKKTLHGRIEVIENNVFLVENPDGPRISYILTGDKANQLKARAGTLARVSGQVEMESKARGALIVDSFLILISSPVAPGTAKPESWIAFAAIKGDRKGVFIMKPDGSQVAKLSNVAGEYSNLCWSDTALELFYDYTNKESDQTVTFKANIQSKRVSPPLPNVFLTPELLDLGYSPDGKSLLEVEDLNGKKQILLRNLLTGQSEKLSDGAGNDNYPTWSADGSKIVFLSDRSGKSQIYILDMKLKKSTLITTEKAIYGRVDWTPDQKAIVAISDKAVIMVTISGDEVKKLTPQEYQCYEVNCSRS